MDQKKTNVGFSKLKSFLKRFWNYMWHDDSIGSYLVTIAVAFVFIKFVFFPVIGFFLGTQIPVVAIVSGSMEHKVVSGNVCGNSLQTTDTYSLSYNDWWEYCGEYYENNFGISKQEFEEFDFSNGLNTGDVMILKGKDPDEIELGDILVFIPGNKEWYARNGPVIHRVVEINTLEGERVFTTKGDQNAKVTPGSFEANITQEQILAVGSLRIPFLGYPKYALVNLQKTLLG